MAEIETLQVKRRDETGKRRNRRLRKSGQVPAILYGHGQDCVSISVPTEQIDAAIRHGARLVDLQGDVSESALIREVQWDTWGVGVLHIDFTRVDKMEKVQVAVPVELRGEAPGVREGGVVDSQLHEIEIECPAMRLPESFEISINDLNLNESIYVKDIELPEGATLVTDGELAIVTVNEPIAVPDEDEEAAAAVEGEPEVIGEKKEEEGGGDG